MKTTPTILRLMVVGFALGMALCLGTNQALGEWTRQFGTAKDDIATAVAADGTGVYAVGTTFGGHFADQTNAGRNDAFVAQHDSGGTLQWIRQFGTPADDAAVGVATDETGVYVGGTTFGALSGQTHTGASASDAFLRKYDSKGDVLWTRQFGTPSFVTSVQQVATDSSGVYLLGNVTDYVTGFRAFVRKFDRGGNVVWTRELPGLGPAVGFAVSGGDLYVSGDVEGSLPGQTSAGQQDAFVVKYDAGGTLLWMRQFGTAGLDSAKAVAVDGTAVYVGGVTSGLFAGQTRVGTGDAFVRKYDPNGNAVWTRQFGTPQWAVVETLSADGTGVYSAGRAVDAFTGQTSSGGEDAFLAKHDASGTLVWTRQFGTSGDERSTGVTIDGTGIYAAGYTSGTFVGEVSTGPRDAFVRRIDRFPSSLRFVPVKPCRVVDTRSGQNTTGVFGAPELAPDTARSFPIADGRCGLPANAGAYSLNVTVVPHGPLSYLTLWPAGQPQPVVSTLNSFEGNVVANAAIVPAGTRGAIEAFATGRTDLILDINGYFTADPGPGALSFYSLTPCRVVDTRAAWKGVFGVPALAPNVERRFPLPNSACGIPGWAAAYALNTTVVPAELLGYLTLWPSGLPQPLVSTLNSFEGSVVANAALLAAGTDGAVSAFATGRTELILDVVGYFGPPGSAGERTFRPINPCRVTDTRLAGAGPRMFGGETRDFTISGTCGVPVEAKGYSLNVTVAPAEPLAYLSLWPSGSTRPTVSTLNSFSGQVAANAALAGAGVNGAVSVYASGATHLILDINGYFQ